MSMGKLDRSGVFQPVVVQGHTTKLELAAEQVAIRKNGIEFLAARPIAAWTELTIDLRPAGSLRAVRGNGVVVDCTGDRHSGYVVSLMFLHLSPDSQKQLSQLAAARLV